MITRNNARNLLIAFLIVSPAAELQASSVAAGIGLGGVASKIASYNIEKIVLT